MGYAIRPETPLDADAIRSLTTAAFENAEHSDGNEAAIVDALRSANALSVSLIATMGDEVVGHVAFSPVTIDGSDIGWFGLGPVSVLPDHQGKGVGADLIRRGLERLRAVGAKGCVVLGDPDYYQKFGFKADRGLKLASVPAEYFMSMPLNGAMAGGAVRYHTAFDASQWPSSRLALMSSTSIAQIPRHVAAFSRVLLTIDDWWLSPDLTR